MKIFIISAISNKLLTPAMKQKLQSVGDVVYIDAIKPLKDISELTTDKGEKIVAIDPDSCGWSVKAEDIDAIPNIKAICLQTTSFAWIDSEFAKNKNIPVTNLRDFSTEAVAEWAFMMALNVARNIPLTIKSGWKQDFSLLGQELKGRTAGIIGMGNIGTRIAELCMAYGMKVQYWSKSTRDDRFDYVTIDELTKASDVIFPAMAHNKDTENLITDGMLKNLKPTAIFVSIIHHIYNHELLLQKVKDGQLHGYAFEQDGGETFLKYEGNVWAGPAMGWCTSECFQRNAEQWVESIVSAAHGKFHTRIN
jgi:lactate dehydrogenase-like 2-hydroxyacid dehydrogenase